MSRKRRGNSWNADLVVKQAKQQDEYICSKMAARELREDVRATLTMHGSRIIKKLDIDPELKEYLLKEKEDEA